MMTEPELARFQTICRYIEAHRDESLPLQALASMADLSPGHFQRRFKAVIGVSPKQYVEACRLNALKEALREGASVTSAVYEAGFGSSSRVYEKLDTRLGMTPRQYRKGGKGLQISYVIAPTSIGLLMMAATDRGLCFIQVGQTPLVLEEELRKEFPHAELSAMGERFRGQFDQWMQALESHLSGENPHLELPLDIQGTAFQRKVWAYLQTIPYGQVRTYTQVAQGIGQPKAVRAAASACGANNLAIVIPCHRVIRSTGALGGYRWGLDVKQALLDQEKRLAVDAF